MRKTILLLIAICLSFLLGLRVQKNKGCGSDRFIDLPEEWRLLKTGDKLKVIKADDRRIELGFDN